MEEIMYTKTLALSNGNKIPQLALGTWMIDDDKAADAVKSAISLGLQAHRHGAGLRKRKRSWGRNQEKRYRKG